MENDRTAKEKVKEIIENKREIIDQFLPYLNKKSNLFILKGGTALSKFYDLPRLSDDIDLDSTVQKNFYEIVESFCKEYGYSFRKGKDTPFVQKAYIYSDKLKEKSLKIEVSYRKKIIDKDEYGKKSGIVVYSLDMIGNQKADAYNTRDKIRDMFDICFLVNNKEGEISKETLRRIRDALSLKGLEQYDYLNNIEDQKDPYIEKDELAESLLQAFDKLGLLSTEEEIEKIKNNIENSKNDIDHK